MPLPSSTLRSSCRRAPRLSDVVPTLVAAVLFVLVAAAALAQNPTYNFKQLRVGAGGFVTGIAIHPYTAGVVYARTDTSGAYRWDEGSQTWTEILTASNVPSPNLGGTADYKVDSIAVDAQNDQVVYVNIGEDSTTGRILKSTDRGQSWTDSGQRWDVNGNGDYRQGGERLAVDPQNDSIVYFGSRTQGLWRSYNGGGSWSQVSTGTIPVGQNPEGNTTPAGVKFVTFDPGSGTQNGGTRVIYIGVAGAGVYRSTDGGASFQQILYAFSVPFDGRVATDGSLYVSFTQAESNGSLQRYVPANNQWQNITPGGGDSWSITTDPFNAQRVFAAPGGYNLNGGLYRSTTSGSSWTQVPVTLDSSLVPWVTTTDEYQYFSSAGMRLDPTQQNRLWQPQGLAAWRTDNPSGSTLTFTNISKGIENPVAADIIAPNGVAVSAIFDREGFYHANPDGYPTRTHIDTISPTGSPQLFGGTGLDWSNSNSNFLVLAEVQNNGAGNPIRGGYSTNGGQTFSTFGSYPAVGTGGNIAVSATNTSNIVWLPSTANFGSGNPPYYSNDGGNSWHQGSGVSSSRTHIFFYFGGKKAMDGDKVVGGKFYLVTDDNNGTFYTSTDGGVSWQQAPNAPTCSVNDVCHVYGQLRAVPGQANNVWAADENGGLFYTTNAGQTPWTHVNGVQRCDAVGFGATASGASYPTVYIAGQVNNQLGIYRSVDQGASWQLLTPAPLGIYNRVATINGDLAKFGRVYVGWDGSGFAYGDDAGNGGGNNGGGGTTDAITSATFPSSITPTGSGTVTATYTTTTSRTLHAYLWDSNFTYKGDASQTVSGSGTATLTVPDYSSIGTTVAYMRVELQSGSTTLDSKANYNIPVQSSTQGNDTLGTVSWPASITSTGSASATIAYSAGSNRTVKLILWDSNYNWRGESTQTVSGNGSVTLTVTDNSSIGTPVAYMRAQLLNGTTQLDVKENDNIPVH